ncbi:putative heavy metal-associated domain, HMA, heavy metal-associated domain superfamily [Helianthus anomalus]
MHCEDCARKIRKCILKMKGVESAVPDTDNSQVVVKGIFVAEELVDRVYKKTGKRAVIEKQDPYPKMVDAMSGKEKRKGW